jgi:hypothetical protein
MRWRNDSWQDCRSSTATVPPATSTPTAQATIPTTAVKCVCGQIMPTTAVAVGALVVLAVFLFNLN